MDDCTSGHDQLSETEFDRLGRFIQEYCGIRMPPAKKTMVEGRLRRRVRALGLPSMHDYCRKLFEEGNLESELTDLINAVTTNKTDFFREIEHFRFLVGPGLRHLAGLEHHPGRECPLKIWSAAASTGAEAYTVAMVLADHARLTRDFRFEIIATDISTDVLEQAKLAIYPEDMVTTVPSEMAARYFRRSRDRNSPTVRVVPQLRAAVRFGYLNLMDDRYGLDDLMDVIFCRNILIYFDKATQEKVLRKLCRHLRPGGYLMVGHSESVSGLALPLRQVATAIFMRE